MAKAKTTAKSKSQGAAKAIVLGKVIETLTPGKSSDRDPLAAVAKELGSLSYLSQLDDIGGMLNRVANAIEGIAEAATMRVIAEHGSPEDRSAAVRYLKRQIDQHEWGRED